MQLKYDNLVGRPFIPNTYDCLSMVIDFYKQNFDIEITNYARPMNWDADTLNLIAILYKREGFVMHDIDSWEPHPGDLLATAIGSSNPNHFVIYVGDNMLLHHKYLHMSAAEPYRPAWKTVSNFVLRHPDVPDLRPVYPDITIEEILRARYAEAVASPR